MSRRSPSRRTSCTCQKEHEQRSDRLVVAMCEICRGAGHGLDAEDNTVVVLGGDQDVVTRHAIGPGHVTTVHEPRRITIRNSVACELVGSIL